MAYTDYLDRVQEIYIGYYQRPADPAGLVYWAARLDASGGDLSEMIEAFADSAEAQVLYGPINADTIDSVINQIYQGFFGRDAEPAGLAYYHQGFVDGTFTAAGIMVNILDGATGLDAYSIQNKVEAANLFTETVDPGLDHADLQVTYTGDTDADAARDFLAGVTSDPNTIPTQAETTNFIISSGIADPGDAIYTHPVNALTTETDNIDLTTTGGITTITGVQSVDGEDNDNGTYNHGDTILGNGLTEFNLIAAGGNGVFATVSDVAKIDVTGAESSTIEALLFTNVDEIHYVDGSGVSIFVDDLDLGTQISVSDVGGSISASYDDVGADLYGWLYNGAESSAKSTLLIDESENITMNLADHASGSVDYDNGPASVGTVGVTAGDDTWSSINFYDYFSMDAPFAASAIDEGWDVTVGDVTVGIGDDSYFELWVHTEDSVSEYADDVTIGAATMTAGDDSALYYVVGDAAAYGGYTVSGPGPSISFDNIFPVAGDVTLGDVSMTVGDGVSYTAFAGLGVAASGEALLGDVTMTGGDDAALIMGVWGDDGVTVGDVDMSAGEDAYEWAIIEGYGDITVGNVSMAAEEDAGLYLTVSGSADLTVGNVSMLAGNDATEIAYFSAWGDGETVTVGDVNMLAGDDSILTFSANNYSNEWTAGMNIGNVSVEAGDDSLAYAYVFNYAIGEAGTAAAVDAGDVTVGDVSVTVGDVTSIDSSTTASVSIGSWADSFTTTSGDFGGVAGNLTVGNVSVAVGNGYVSNTLTTEAFGYIGLSLTGDYGAGDMTVGDITMTGGDFASLSLYASHYASYDDVGAFSMGNVNIEAGESANISVTIDHSNSSTGNVGTFTLGDIDVLMAQDSYASIDIDNYAMTGNIDDMAVGNISIVSGDNSTANLYILSSASDGSNGAMTVGDISIALSATTTLDLAGGSSIYVSLEHYAESSWDSFGELTVGDIDLSAGDAANIDLNIYNEATADVVGDETVGNITITAGDASSVTIYSYYSATDNSSAISQMGDFTLAGVDVQMGDDAYLYGWMSVSQSDDFGDVGNVSYGDLTISVGDSADAYFGQYLFASDDVESLAFGDLDVTMGDGGTLTVSRYADIDGDLENLSFGSITVNAGDDAILDIEESGTVSVAGDLETVSIGDVNITIGDGASLSYSPTISVSGDIGEVLAGDISITAGEDAYVSYTVNIYGDEGIGNVTLGDVTVDLDTSASLEYLWFSATATSGSVGNFTMGDVSLTLGEESYLYGGFSITAADEAGDMTVGDVTVDAAAGAALTNLYFNLQAGEAAGDLTAGALTITAVDGEVTATSAGVYGTADVGLAANGATVNVSYTLTGTNDATLTVGDITVDLDTLSDVSINIDQNSTGDIVIGDLTVSGAVGTVTYTGGALTETGTFSLNVSDSSVATIGDVDFSGYVGDIDIDVTTWADLGAANILGNDGVNTITGNSGANAIDAAGDDDTLFGGADNDILTGGTGVDLLYGQGGNDTFVFSDGDSGTTVPTLDIVQDWGAAAGNTDKLDFNHVAATAQNFLFGPVDGAAIDLAGFIANANDGLNSTVAYYAEVFGGNTYVAVNYGSGDADLIVELLGDQSANLTYADVIA